MRRRAYEPHEEANINLTSLIDVVFVVLIIFIIIAPMLEIDKIDLASAAPTQKKEMGASPENHGLTIHVRGDNTILFQGRKVTLEQLTTSLKEAHQRGVRRAPQLFQDKNAYFGTYQSVKNAVEVAGFDELDVILKPSG